MFRVLLLIATVAFANFLEYELEPEIGQEIEDVMELTAERRRGVLDAVQGQLSKKKAKKLRKLAKSILRLLKKAEKKIVSTGCPVVCTDPTVLAALKPKIAGKACKSSGCEFTMHNTIPKTYTCAEPAQPAYILSNQQGGNPQGKTKKSEIDAMSKAQLIPLIQNVAVTFMEAKEFLKETEKRCSD